MNTKLSKKAKERIRRNIFKTINKEGRYKKAVFIEDSGTYTNEIIVAIGSTYEDILKWIKNRTDVKAEELKNFQKEKENIEKELKGGYLGFVFNFNKGYCLLWMKPFTDCWAWWDVLIHEVCHVTQILMKSKGIEDNEAFAYQQEYLVRKLRRRISKIYKLK